MAQAALTQPASVNLRTGASDGNYYATGRGGVSGAMPDVAERAMSGFN